MATTYNPATFLQEVRTELGKVRFPTRAETIRLTLIVIALSLGMAAFIGTIDVILVKLTEVFLR